MLKYTLIIIISAIATFVLKGVVKSIGYAEHAQTMSALLTISSIIFAIIGAWIAIIYPKAIGQVFNSNSSQSLLMADSSSDTKYLSELVEIAMVSAIVLMLVLFMQFSAPLAKAIVPPQITDKVKIGVFFIICILATSQLYAIFRVILANYFFLNELRAKNVSTRTDLLHK